MLSASAACNNLYLPKATAQVITAREIQPSIFPAASSTLMPVLATTAT